MESDKRYYNSEKCKKWRRQYYKKRSKIMIFCSLCNVSYPITKKWRHRITVIHQNNMEELIQLNELAKARKMLEWMREESKFEKFVKDGIIELTDDEKDYIRLSELNKLCTTTKQEVEPLLLNQGLKVSVLNGYPIIRKLKLNQVHTK